MATIPNIPKDSDLPGNQHVHACGCGDYRVCSKDCNLGNRDRWTCPDCATTEKLDALYQEELRSINSYGVQHATFVNRLYDRVFIKGENQ
jgi:hypothetical protein